MEIVLVFITDIMFNYKLLPDNGNVTYSILTQSLCSQMIRPDRVPETIKFLDISFVTSHQNIFIFYLLLGNGFLKQIDFVHYCTK